MLLRNPSMHVRQFSPLLSTSARSILGRLCRRWRRRIVLIPQQAHAFRLRPIPTSCTIALGLSSSSPLVLLLLRRRKRRRVHDAIVINPRFRGMKSVVQLSPSGLSLISAPSPYLNRHAHRLLITPARRRAFREIGKSLLQRGRVDDIVELFLLRCIVAASGVFSRCGA